MAANVQAAVAAYDEAVRVQGGLIYLSKDDEFSALANPARIASFVGAGNQFDYRRGEFGRTAGMRAAIAGAPGLVVEVDGGVHELGSVRVRDVARESALVRFYCVRVLRIEAALVERDPYAAVALIRAALR